MSEATPSRIGQIVGAFGLRGEMKVQPLTEFWERFQKGARLRLKGEWVTVKSYREHKNRPLIKVTGVDDISAAEALQWEYLEAIIADRPDLDDDEYLTKDLIGLQVVTVGGTNLGIVSEVMPMPTHDVLVVGEVLIPVVKQFVKKIDIQGGAITVELIPGMLPGEES
ncbi:ribosome maturation factor RimM [Fimbriimonas ginsengisoli]|nr:ribosome maturation factor RimM [Fimbriimonas ginsengisoli]